LILATMGGGSTDEERLRALTAGFDVDVFPFDRATKARSGRRLLREIRRRRYDLVVMEGTGLAGGLALILGRLLAGVPYVVSSGDAVGPFVGSKIPLLGPAFGLYERVLCAFSAGFIGWTPYLAGRALSFGAPRAMTAAGWTPSALSPERRDAARDRVRRRLGISAGALVVGVAGSLVWNRRVAYCYGWELVKALKHAEGPAVAALIVGDGDGRRRLEELAGQDAGRRIHFTGRVPRPEVPEHLAAMDLASLPQSVDGVGSFRYTTKLSEYLAAGLPVVTGQLPFAYDLDDGWLWRLPGQAPWRPSYPRALAALLDGLGADELRRKAEAASRAAGYFDCERQARQTTAFLTDILARRP